MSVEPEVRALLDAVRDEARGDEERARALAELDGLLAGAGDALPASMAGFARLIQASALIARGELGEAARAGRSLTAVLVDGRGDPGTAAGVGAMGLDLAVWLLAAGAGGYALEICATVIATLADGDPAEAAVAAGARFVAAQAAARLGRPGESREQIEALCQMGEPALAALDRIATRYGTAQTDPAWHAQVAATSTTVLWRLGRGAEAAQLARQAADAFRRQGRDDIAEMLATLAGEVAGT